MKLIAFSAGGAHRIGLLKGESVIDLSVVDPTLTDMVDLIGRGADALASLVSGAGTALAVDDIGLEAPIAPRKNVIAVGRNFLEHIREAPGADAATRHRPSTRWCSPSRPPPSSAPARLSTPPTTPAAPPTTRGRWQW